MFNFLHFPTDTFGSMLRALFLAALVSVVVYAFEALYQRKWVTWNEKGSLPIDLLYIFISAIDGVAFTKLIFWTYALIVPNFPNHFLGGAHAFFGLAAGGFFVSIAAGLIFTDIVGYIMHRLFHEVPALWRFHAVHHAVKDNYSLNGNRFHPFNLLLGRARAAFMILFGWPIAHIVTINLCISICNKYAHGKFYGLPKWLHHFFITPEYHIYHHAVAPEIRDKNYASMFPFIDRIGGTYYHPKAGDPFSVEMGCDDPVPKSFLGQMIYPFAAIYADYKQKLNLEKKVTL